ncbi:MAG: dTMP kinase [Firmicutes bacterium]|nr:dTMP kinase [Bacillota bacterium]
MMKGIFITVEGGDGAGKSTQVSLIEKYLKDKGLSPLMIREPGGTSISEQIRSIILDKKNIEMANMTEVLLYAASRAQLVDEVIVPALQRGRIVVCDRFLDSSIAYQGFGRGISVKAIEDINSYATAGVSPDLTIYLDITPERSFRRKSLMNEEPDMIEAEKLEFHQNVYNGYKYVAEKYPERVFCVDAAQDVDKVFEDIKNRLDLIFNV